MTPTDLTLGFTLRTRAMGTTCTVTVAAADPALHARRAIERVAELEDLWSRFRPGSDIGRLNSSRGQAVSVAHPTRYLIAMMKEAHRLTEGAFNPTLLPLQTAAGDITSRDGSTAPALPEGTAAWASLDSLVDRGDGTVRMPRGMSLDAGGMGKGLAADIVATEAVNDGAVSACVNIGGDLRVVRREGSSTTWPVTITPPVGIDVPTERIVLLEGGVATSDASVRMRPDGSVPRHHFSVTGTAASDTAGATVVASTSAWAEAWTKFAMTRPAAETVARLTALGLAGRIVSRDGTVTCTDSWKAFVR